jgi:hypothetical protein
MSITTMNRRKFVAVGPLRDCAGYRRLAIPRLCMVWVRIYAVVAPVLLAA